MLHNEKLIKNKIINKPEHKSSAFEEIKIIEHTLI